ncbi:MAG: thiamine-phosphate kinase [Pedosphaera sp.]|nr:thiamine-phosphate kinase [Pedosphaera sp.]
MNEFDLIRRLKPLLTVTSSVVTGAGDDCAVLANPGSGREILLKTDIIVEDIHFTPTTEPSRIGRKALARVISDIAAMGGIPTAAVITLGLPVDFVPERIEAIYAGMADLARQYHIALVGGETSRSQGVFFINVALTGWVETGCAVLRSGAQLGDALFVSGELGGSIEGHHLDFTPRLEEGRWLAQQRTVHAMIDLSDGLAGDLPHLLEASGIPGAEIHASALPFRRSARLRARSGDTAKPAVAAALTDGEDFELLFAVAPANAIRLLDGWKSQFPNVRISCIGRLTSQPGVFLRNERGLMPVTANGFQHFS